ISVSEAHAPIHRTASREIFASEAHAPIPPAASREVSVPEAHAPKRGLLTPPRRPVPAMSDTDRTVSPARRAEEAAEASLRPQTLAEFVGQRASRENLAVFIQAARARAEALDHVLLHGPPGLGKTTLAQIVA